MQATDAFYSGYWVSVPGHEQKDVAPLRSNLKSFETAGNCSTVIDPSFALVSWRGIGVALPPSWMEPAFHDRPSAVRLLTTVDRWLGTLPVFRGLADHILLRFVREDK